MALTLEGATFGYDASNLPTLLNEIRVNCVEAAVDTLNSGISSIEAVVDEAWVGTSATKYKEKFRADVKIINTKLQDLGDKIEAELKNAGQGMVDVDQSINF